MAAVRQNNWMMTSRVVAGVTVLALLACGPVALAAQSSSPPSRPVESTPPSGPPPAVDQAKAPAGSQSQASQDESSATVDLDRIKNALQQPATILLNDKELRFYVRVVAKQPSFSEMVGSFDLKNGPVPGAGMTHQEFLNQVTPKELYGSGGITAPELLQFALVNAGFQAIKKAWEDYRAAKTDREREEIRKRIDRELEALRGGGQ